MKRSFLGIVIVLFTFTSASGQQNTQASKQSSQDVYTAYMKKHKTNRTAGWITLGSGVAMIVGGYAINTGDGIIDNDTTNNNKGLWLSYFGAATTLASIPLFIASGNNKRKAKIELKNSTAGITNKSNYNSMAFTITF
tara:strand:+ start:220879 stop:221292 length:414 start_codon:yes stop_codon:yes gene_type:complete